MRPHLQTRLLAIVFLLSFLSSCNRDVWRAPPPATPVPTGGPAFSDKLWGKIGSVLVTDVPVDTDEANQLWVGFNSVTEWQHLHGGELGRTSWIGGEIKLDPAGQYGFYFDPETTEVAAQPVPGLQTTIAQIRKQPQRFTSGKWYVHGRVLRRLGPARNWH